LTQTTYYYDSAGTDLGVKYAPRSQMYLWEQTYGSQADTMTGFLNSAGADLGNLFAHAGKATTLKSVDLLNYAQWTNQNVGMSQSVTPQYVLENGYKPPLSWNWSIIDGDADLSLSGATSETCSVIAPATAPFAIKRCTLQLQLTDSNTGIVLTDTCSVSFVWDSELSPGGATSSSGSTGTTPPPSTRYTGATQPGELYAIRFVPTNGSMVDGGTISRYQTVELYFVSGATPHAVNYQWSIGASSKTGSPTPSDMTLNYATSSSAQCVATSGTPDLASTTVSAPVTVTVTDAVNTSLSATATETVTFTWTKSGD
jgi:hypothetical protein